MPKRYAYPLRKSPKSDPQQFQIYRMESEAIGARNYGSMTRANIVRLVNGICRKYGAKRATVVYKDLGKWAAQWCPPATIELSTRKRTSMDYVTITHELAHHIHASFGDFTATQEPHGPEFMACHMSILDTCRAIPVAAMKVVCQQYKIRYNDPGERNSLTDLSRAVLGKSQAP